MQSQTSFQMIETNGLVGEMKDLLSAMERIEQSKRSASGINGAYLIRQRRLSYHERVAVAERFNASIACGRGTTDCHVCTSSELRWHPRNQCIALMT